MLAEASLPGRPLWLVLTDKSLWPTIEAAYKHFAVPKWADLETRATAMSAVLHLRDALHYSWCANREGRHALSIALARHCVEAVTIIDIALQPRQEAEHWLARWADGKASQGDLRKYLEKSAWPKYGYGLWKEPWTQYFGNLARAVQPYAHCSPELFQWHLAVRSPLIQNAKGEYRLFFAERDAYDGVKATRLTLLHSLIGWTVAQILAVAGVRTPLSSSDLQELSTALANAEYLERWVTDWSRQFWPHIVDMPQGDAAT